MEPPPVGKRRNYHAPSYDVSAQRVVSIDHPCIVKDLDLALRSVGGEHQLKQILCKIEQDDAKSRDDGREDRPKQSVKPVIGLSLRPNDPYARKIPSVALDTQDVLLRVTMPAQTGRKRKRGSGEPFAYATYSAIGSRDDIAQSLRRKIRDGADNCIIEAIGTVSETHQFNQLPDLQFRSSEVPIMREIYRHATTADYGTLKHFHVDLAPGSEGLATFPPPPTFIPLGHQYSYDYQPNEAAATKPSKRPDRVRKLLVTYDPKDSVPIGPPSSLVPATDARLLDTIDKFRALLVTRPIVTRRAASNLLYPCKPALVIAAIDHVGYYVSSGPWRDAIIAYGVDPGSDPKYRFYQTISCHIKDTRFRRPSRNAVKVYARQGHVFDGKNLPGAGKRWQFCDFTDSVLHNLVNTGDLLSSCDKVSSGWYHGGTISKIRMIIREKTRAVMTGDFRLRDDEYEELAAMPDAVRDSRPQVEPLERGPHLLRCMRMVRKETLGRFGGQDGDDTTVSVKGRRPWRESASVSRAGGGDEDESVLDDEGVVADDEDVDGAEVSEADGSDDDEQDDMDVIDPRLQDGLGGLLVGDAFDGEAGL